MMGGENVGHEQIKDILERQLWLLNDRAGLCKNCDLPGMTSAMVVLANALVKLDRQHPSITARDQAAERNGGTV